MRIAYKLAAVPGASLEYPTPNVPLDDLAVQLPTRPLLSVTSRKPETGPKASPARELGCVVPLGLDAMKTPIFVVASDGALPAREPAAPRTLASSVSEGAMRLNPFVKLRLLRACVLREQPMPAVEPRQDRERVVR